MRWCRVCLLSCGVHPACVLSLMAALVCTSACVRACDLRFTGVERVLSLGL